MMILKRKEIVAAALVALIGVAGYLNWSYQDTVKVTDGKSYTEAKKLGEAQYVNSEDKKEEVAEVSSSSFFTEAKTEKESSREKALQILEETAQNEDFDADIRKKAQEKILENAENAEKETAVENACKAKGYKDVTAYIDEGACDVTVKKADFSETDAQKIKDIVTSYLEIDASKVKIVSMK